MKHNENPASPNRYSKLNSAPPSSVFVPALKRNVYCFTLNYPIPPLETEWIQRIEGCYIMIIKYTTELVVKQAWSFWHSK